MRRAARFAVAVLALVACCTRGPAALGAERPIDPALVARAKAEGRVVLYAAIVETQLAAIAQRFEAAYGIKVETLRAESDKLIGRVLTEQRAGHLEADLVSEAGFQSDQLKRAGIYATFRPPEAAELLAGTADPDGTWTSVYLNTEAIAYNPARLKAAGLQVPRGWEDFAAPAWRGQFGLYAAGYEWYAAMKRFYGRQRADDLMRAYADNSPRMLGSHQLGIQLTEVGDVLGAPNVFAYQALLEKQNGQAIDFVNPTPTVLEIQTVGIVKTAPHPNAAQLLVRWWLSRATQQWERAELHRLSPRKDVKNDPRLLDPKVRYIVSNPADSVNYNDDVKAFNALFRIPG